MKKAFLIIFLVLEFAAVFAQKNKTNGEPFGVNIACADFGSVFPGEYNKDFTYPTASDLDYWHKKEFKLVRFPFKWERLQYDLYGELTPFDLSKMKEFVKAAQERDMKVILDLHNYCRRYINKEHRIIGTNGLTVEHLADFWKQMALEFKGFQNIYAYGLMNEPHDLDPGTSWFKMAQTCIDSIRKVDTKTCIMVGGVHWSSADKWLENSDSLKFLVDPSKNLRFEAHCYFDNYGSGTYKRGFKEDSCFYNKGIEKVKPFVKWIRENKFRGFVGEYGIPDNDKRWNITLDRFLKYLQRNNINGTYWAAGPWWSTYFMSIEPIDKKERPQMEVVDKYKYTK